MTYYEELGIAPNASMEDVRQAYRCLARLLHPDSQADERLRAMAERQMTRLNEIHETLTDPRKRSEYDDMLESQRPRSGGAMLILTPKPLSWRQAALRHWFYILLGSASLATAIAWYSVPRQQTVEGVPAVANADGAAPESAPPAVSPPARRRAPAAARRARRKSKPASSAARLSAIPPPAPLAAILPEPLAPSLSAPPEIPAPRATPARRASRFAGSWLYTARSATAAIPGHYPALYVECLLREQAGEIIGTYRAKHKIPDQAISSEVAFHLRGTAPAGGSGRVHWTAGDGAKGTAELMLRSDDTLSVVWWTTDAGRRPAMSSGEAILIRQLEKDPSY